MMQMNFVEKNTQPVQVVLEEPEKQNKKYKNMYCDFINRENYHYQLSLRMMRSPNHCFWSIGFFQIFRNDLMWNL